MKLNVLGLVLAASAFTSLAANAQTTVIERHDDPAIVVEHEKRAATVIEKHDAVVGEKKVITHETTGVGCDSKTVHREGIDGSTTVKKTNCD